MEETGKKAMTQQEIVEKMRAEFSAMTPKQVVDTLDKMHRSEGYVVIRDVITIKTISDIKADTELYKVFQSIKQECKQSWEYDHRMASIKDVNTAATNLYGIILKLMKASNDDMGGILTKVQIAINTIEEKIGIDKTIWVEENDDANVEGVQEDNR